jgi:hypothetical protein
VGGERRDVMEFLECQPDALPGLGEVLCGRRRATDLQGTRHAAVSVRLAKVLLRMPHSETLGRSARLRCPGPI